MTVFQAVLFLLAIIVLSVGAIIAFASRAFVTGLAFLGAALALLAYALPGLTHIH